MPLWSALEFPALLSGSAAALQVRVYGFPKVVTLEHMALGLFLAGRMSGVLTEVQRTIQFTKNHFPEHHCCSLAEGLLRLLDEYIPALLHIGILVRDLYWEHTEPNTGHHAKEVMLRCLCLLHALEPSPGTEYVRSLSNALLLWSDELHSALPGRAFVEECLEASLAVLSGRIPESVPCPSVDQFRQFYQSQGPPSQSPREVNHPGLAEVFPYRLELRLKRLCAVLRSRSLLFVSRPRKGFKHCSVTTAWPPSGFQLPGRIVVGESDAADYLRCLQFCLRQLLEPKTVDDSDQFDPLTRGNPTLSEEALTTERTNLTAVLAQLNRLLSVPVTALRTQPRHQSAAPSGPAVPRFPPPPHPIPPTDSDLRTGTGGSGAVSVGRESTAPTDPLGVSEL